jgi:AcrR family transcriptional regulator
MVLADPARPMRADARRNYDAIVAVARTAFGEHGPGASLDDIAKRAGVGAGTLYRHFPTREALIEAVYRGEIGELSERAHKLLAELPPEEALPVWIKEQIHWIVRNRGLAMTLKASIEAGSETFAWCQSNLRGAAGALLAAAQDAGAVRRDVTAIDVLRIGHGVGVVTEHATAEESRRMLSIMLKGLEA